MKKRLEIIPRKSIGFLSLDMNRQQIEEALKKEFKNLEIFDANLMN